MQAARTARPVLRLVSESEREPPVPLVWFCSHCGARPTPTTPAARSRVCGVCGLGLILESRADVAPRVGDAFLVLDCSLAVCAVSDAAERLLAVSEPDAVNRHVSDLLVPAEAEGRHGQSMAAAVAWAARGDGGQHTTVVRPANTFGIRLTARITSCGPPRAALLVLE